MWCPCGAFRPQPLMLLRLDAAQFFKSTNPDRGRADVRSMLARLRSSRASTLFSSCLPRGQLAASWRSRRTTGPPAA
eukprot:2076037-Alexandrium_andersonii.AAC.1